MEDLIFNVKGLTAADRAQWEKDNIEALKGTDYITWSEDRKDRYFKNVSFKNKYGFRDDYESLKSHTPEERDSIFNLDLGEEETLTDVVERSNIYSNVKRSSQFKGISDKYIKDFEDIASNVSPYYKRYLDTDYLPWKEEDKIDAYARYQSILSTTGSKEMADRDLATNIQNQVAENQSPLDKWLRGANKASASIIGTINTTLGFLGGLVASPVLSWTGYNEEETKDLNAWQTYWHNVVNNPYNKFWNRVMNRGTINRDVLYSDNPEDNYDRNEIINTVEQDDDLLKFIFSENFLPNMVSQSGFTIGSMASGQLLSRGIGGIIGWRQAAAMNGVNTADELANALDKVQKLAQTERRLNAYFVPAIVGSTEGVVNALNTYDNSLRDFSQQIENETEQRVQAIKEVLLSDPNKMQELGYNATTEEALESQIRASLAPAVEDMYRKAREEAAESELTNFTINSFINGAGNVFLKSPMLGGRVKESIGRTKIGRLFSSDSPRFNYSGGNVVYNVPSIFTRIADGAKETFGESAEEYLQEISDSFSQGWGAHSMENFIARRFNGESYDAIEDSLSEELGAALMAAGKSAVSKEAIKSGVLGGLSQAMGTATINTQAFKQAKDAKTTSDKVTNFIRTFWRSPFLESSAEFKAEKAAGEKAAEAMNNWLNEGNNMERFKSTVGAASWIREMNEYDESGDEFSYRNSKFGKLLNDAFMVHELRGTELYDSYIQQFQDIINAEKGSELAANIEQMSGVSLEEAKQHAQDVLDNISKVSEELEILEENIGKHANDEVKKALIYGKLNEANLRERGEKLESEINQGYITTRSDEERRKLARGNENRFKVEALEKEAEKLSNEIDTSERNISILSKQQKKELKNKIAKYNNLVKQISSLKNEGLDSDNAFLTQGEILGLNAIDRYMMLNPKNRKFYNEAQLAIIDNLIHEKELTDMNFMQKVEDAARIEQVRAQYAREYSKALRDPGNLNRLAGLLSYNLTLEQKRKQYSSLNNIQTKEEFLERFEKEFDNAKDMISRQMLMEAVKDNQFYKEILESEEDTQDFDVRKNNNEDYNKLEDKAKKQIEAVEAFLESKKISPKSTESLEAITANNGNDLLAFIEQFNQQNPENQIEFDNIGEVIGNYQSIVDSLIKEEQEEDKVTNKAPERTDAQEPPAPAVEEQNVDGAPEVRTKVQKLTDSIIRNLESDDTYKEGIEEVKEVLETLNPDSSASEIAQALDNYNFNNPVAKAAASQVSLVLSGNEFARTAQQQKEERKANTESGSEATLEVIIFDSIRGQSGFEALEQFYTIYGIDDYLKSHVLGRKDGIFFVYDPTLASQVSSSMGNKYSIADTPIILVVQDNNGDYEIDGVKYQPIGVYKGKNQTKDVILNSIKGNNKQIIKQDNKPIVTTINKYIESKAPRQIPQGQPNIPIGTVAFDDESPATREAFNQASNEDKETFYQNLKRRILSKIKYVGKDENPRNPDPHIAYTDTDNKVGGEAQIDIFIVDPENTVTRDDKSFKDVLLNGSITDILTYNSRLYGIEDTFNIRPRGFGFANALRKFFEEKPFDGVGDNKKKLEELNKRLNDTLSNYLMLSSRGNYRLELVPTGTKVGEVDTYTLALKGPTRLIKDDIGNIRSQEYNYTLGTVYNGTIDNEEIVNIIKNLFLDENNNFRKVSYNGKEEPLVKWNVNYDSFIGGKNDATSGAAKHREEVYDDNILSVSKYSLKRTIVGVSVHNPISITSKSNATNTSNKDNSTMNSAETNNTNNGRVEVNTGIVDNGNPGKNEDNTESNTERIKNKIIEHSKQLSRTTDEKFYSDGTRNYVRATSIIRDIPYTPFEYEVPSAAIGNSVDLFVRDFFNGRLNDSYPNATSEDWESLRQQLETLKTTIEHDGFTVISEIEYPDGSKDGVRVKGTIEVVDNKGVTHKVNAAGTLDLLAYNPITGKFRIYDIKTLRNKNNVSNDSYLEKWGRQLSLYKTFLETEYGIEVESTSIIPIHVDYPKASYEVRDNQLSINGIDFKGAEPKLLNTVSIDTSKIKFKVNFNALNEAEQQLILGELPEGTKPKEVKKIEAKLTPIKRRGNLSAKPIGKGNIAKDLHLSDEAHKEGEASLIISDNSWEKIQESLTPEQFEALKERFKKLNGKELTKELWDSFSEKLKERNLDCIRG